MIDLATIGYEKATIRDIEFYVSYLNSPGTPESIAKALDKLHPEELELLRQFAGEGKRIFLNRLGKNNLRAGRFSFSNTECSLTLSLTVISGKFVRGTIYHELGVHWQQWKDGRLGVSEDGKDILWDGRVVDIETVPYLELPWEVEAHRKEADFLKRTGKIRSVSLLGLQRRVTEKLVALGLKAGQKYPKQLEGLLCLTQFAIFGSAVYWGAGLENQDLGLNFTTLFFATYSLFGVLSFVGSMRNIERAIRKRMGKVA